MKKIKNRIFLMIIILLTIYPNLVYAKFPNFKQDLEGYLIAEYDSGEILSSFNTEGIVPIASITKLMTYILVQDAIKDGGLSLNSIVTITEDISTIGGSSLNLSTGSKATINQLIDGLLIVSGNDAAYALAKTVSGSEELFTKAMNEKAEEIGLENAHFVNSTGLPDVNDNSENNMSIEDIYIMTRYILDNYPEILDRTSRQVLSIPELGIEKISTIPLLGEIRGIDGLKTGTTTAAGYCLVSTFNLYENNNLEKNRFISITMGAIDSKTREDIIREIVNYIDSSYIYGTFFNEDEVFTQVEINSVDSEVVNVFPRQQNKVLFDKTDISFVSENITINAKGPLKAGETVGVLSIKTNSGKVYNIDLIVNENHARASIFLRIQRMFRDIARDSAILLGFN